MTLHNLLKNSLIVSFVSFTLPYVKRSLSPFKPGLSYSTTTIPNVTPGATGIVTVNVVNLPLTYYGPSIPLGTDGNWVWGGLTSPGPEDSTTESEAPATSAPETSESASSVPTTTNPSVAATPTSSSLSATTTATPSPSSSSALPSSTSTDGQGSITGGATETPAAPGTPIGPRFSSGAVVAAVVCGFVALVLAIVLFILIRKWGRHRRRSYYRSSRSEEEMFGGGEVASLLSGRLAGGESPPAPRSPTASMRSAMGPAMRPRTPLSTRALSTRQGQLGYTQAATNTPPALPPRPRSPSPQHHVVSRASTDEVHRISDQSQQHQDVPSINVQRATMSPRDRLSNLFHLRRSPRAGPGQGTSSVLGYIPFLTPRTRTRTLSELGEGWQEVQAPPPAVMGLGIHIPEEQQYSNAPPTPFPPASLNTSSLPSRMDRPHSTLTTMDRDRPRSTISGQTVYLDARSRPTSPPGGLVPPSLTAQSREMGQRDAQMVSRGGPSSGVLPPLRPKPSDSSLTGLQLVRDKELAPDPASTYYVQVSPYGDDDALDAPVPAGLLPPGLEHGRALGSKTRWSKSAIEEEDEGEALDAKGKPMEIDALLDSAPPAPMKKWVQSLSEDSEHGAASGSGVASQLSRPRSREQEERDIADDDSYFQDVGGAARRTRFVTATPIILGGPASRDSEHTQASASAVPTMTYGTTDTGTNRQTMTTSLASPTFVDAAPGTPFEMVTVPGSATMPGDEWTLGLDSHATEEAPHPYPLQSIYEWFRLHPGPSASQPELAPGPTFGIPASGGPPVIITGRARPDDENISTSEEGSSLLRVGNGSEDGRRRSRLSDVIPEEP
ncbi:hypothetical protein FRC02_007872 [Tulasnella sp. 418]|nr:hypothetical protein FRC02_007872 [Tulasnella sp. 418]